MKKNLAVRAGAIVMILFAAFFFVLPDMIKAKGEDGQEVTAESSHLLSDGTEVSSAQEMALPEEIASEISTENTQKPAEEISTDTLGTENVPNSETETVSELPTETETSAPNSTETDTSLPNNTETIIPAPTETEVFVPNAPETEKSDAFETEMPVLDTPKQETETENKKQELETETVKLPENAKNDTTESYNHTTDFITEGTVLTGYQGAGGMIQIPDGITAIADNAFYGNTSITGVNFSGSVHTIGSSAFNGCSNLSAISIPDTVKTVGVSAFANCTGLASVNLSGASGSLVQGEFYNCSALTSVTVPEGIASIASDAFGNCSNLQSISLPASLSSLDVNAFSGNTNLSSISVAGGNARYAAHDGCLYSAGYSELILCPPGKTDISFASGVSAIASGAFSGCKYVGVLTLPDTIRTVASSALSGSGIHSITVPKTVTALGAQSGWTPKIVYGYTESAAEKWAAENGYIFEALNKKANAPGNGGGSKPNDIEGGNGGTNENGNSLNENGAATSTVSAAVTTSGYGTGKDTTPKTGVEDYGMYCLFAAILLMGVACFAYSKKLRYEE